MRVFSLLLLVVGADAIRHGRRPKLAHSSCRAQSASIRPSWMPCGDTLDGSIARVFLPSAASFAVVPLTGAVDTFWVGRMGDALALAGQGAANQVFNAFFFVIGFVPKVTVPLVATAFAAGDAERAADRTCDSLFVACLVGALGTALLVGAPQLVLRTVMPPDALAAPLATRYLRLRALSVVPAAFSAVTFAAFRGTLDAITPLRVSIASNLVRLATHQTGDSTARRLRLLLPDV